MDPTLSILIVNWNTRALLLDCLRSLARCELGCSHEIVVVDNASADGSAEAVAAEFPDVRLIASPENLGFARGNNLAYREAAGRYLLLLNPDTRVAPGNLEKLVAFLEAHPQAGIVGPKLLNEDGSFQLSAVPFIQPWDLYFEHARFPRRLQPRAQKQPRRLYPFEPWRAMAVDYVIGAAFLIRREVVTAIGPMDEAYFMYGEEQDWCFRAKAAGWEVHFVPDAEVTHLEGQATRQIPARMLAHRYASSFRFMRKHRGERALALTRGLVGLAAAQNAALAAVRWLFRRDDGETFRRQWRDNRVLLATALAGAVPPGLD